MNAIAPFHSLVAVLLDSIGFELGDPEPGQDLFTLLVDDHYTLHLGRLDPATGYARVELPDTALADAPYAEWLQRNAFDETPLQPTLALDAFRRPMCHLRFPIAPGATPELRRAFLAMLAQADALRRHAPAPGPRRP